MPFPRPPRKPLLTTHLGLTSIASAGWSLSAHSRFCIVYSVLADRACNNLQAIMDLRRLVKYHSSDLQSLLPDLCRLLRPAVLALRSNTSRMSMTLIQVP